MEIYYRETNEGVRVWQITWTEDQFEVFHPGDFATFKACGERLGFSFFKAED